jgi:hypothetical protein
MTKWSRNCLPVGMDNLARQSRNVGLEVKRLIGLAESGKTVRGICHFYNSLNRYLNHARKIVDVKAG